MHFVVVQKRNYTLQSIKVLQPRRMPEFKIFWLKFSTSTCVVGEYSDLGPIYRTLVEKCAYADLLNCTYKRMDTYK